MTTPDTTRELKLRSRWLADEVGPANVEIVADAYWHGYAHALAEARHALADGTSTVPRPTPATISWLAETTPRLRYRDLSHDVLTDDAGNPIEPPRPEGGRCSSCGEHDVHTVACDRGEHGVCSNCDAGLCGGSCTE